MAGLMDGTSHFPSRAEMELGLVAFAQRTGIKVRYGCRWEATRRETTRRRRKVRSRNLGRRIPVPGRRLRRRRRRAVRARHAGPGSGAPLRRHEGGGNLRRQADLHRRQAELRVRARQRPVAVGSLHRPCLPQPGEALGRHAVPGGDPRPLPPAIRGPRSGRRRCRARRLDRSHRAGRERAPRHRQSVCGRRTRRLRSGRGDRRNGLRGAAAGLAGARRRYIRIEPAARPDALLGERHRPRNLLRRDDQPGCRGPAQARPAGQLGGRPRGPLQRPPAWRAHRRQALRPVPAQAEPGGVRGPAVPRRRDLPCPRAMASARVPGSRREHRSGGGHRRPGIRSAGSLPRRGRARRHRRHDRGRLGRRSLSGVLSPPLRQDRRARPARASVPPVRLRRAPAGRGLAHGRGWTGGAEARAARVAAH